VLFRSTWQPGIFIGWTKNQGSQNDIINSPATTYQRVSNIDDMTRISPRLLYNTGKVRLALEVEITNADYGTTNTKAEVVGVLHTVTNMRVLGAVYYFFGT
jgi:spore germination protein GerM